MDDIFQVLKVSGEMAGIGGLSLGVFLVLFRQVIRKNVFRRLSPEDSYRLFRLLLCLVFLISALGLTGWLVLELQSLPSRHSTSGFEQTTTKLEKDFPVKFGDSRGRVRTLLGEPQEKYVVWDSFYSEGMNIYYDRHTKEVDGFFVTQLQSGTSYQGSVFNIRLGDPFEKAKAILGRPDYWGLPEETSSLAVWQKGGNRTILTLSRQGETSGRITSITWCRDNSFANYTPVVAATIQQLKNRQPLTLIEEDGEPFLGMLRQDDPCFQSPYHIVDASLAQIGGAFVIVDFTESKAVLFYIYPLEWKTPRVRMIVDLDEDGNPRMPRDVGSAQTNAVLEKAIDIIMKVESADDGAE